MKPIKPMLLTEYPDKVELINKQRSVFVQPKLDGWRAIGNTKTGEIFSRNGKLLNLPHISVELLELGKKNFPEWVDGELYKHGETLGKIQSMIRKSDSGIEFHIFDFVGKDGFSKRFYHESHSKKYSNFNNIKIVKTESVNPMNIRKKYKKYLDLNYEGIIIRIDNQPYHNYRSEQVIKLKPECDYEN